jgi:hypothetical protein
MPADFWAVVVFLGVVVAASLLVCGVWKLDVRLLAGGAVLAGALWLGLGCTNPDEWLSHEVVTLRLRPVDAVSGEMVADAVVNAGEPPGRERSAAGRLPARPDARPDGSAAALAVSLVVELRVKGSLVEQYQQPAACSEATDQLLEITAPGYRPWRGRLARLLPEGWPIARPAEAPILIELRPE